MHRLMPLSAKTMSEREGKTLRKGNGTGTERERKEGLDSTGAFV